MEGKAKSTCKIVDIQKYMGRYIDICVVVLDTESPRTIPLRNGEVTQKQRVSVVDDSAILVSLVWNTAVKSLDDSIGQRIIVKGVKVKRYNETIYLELPKTGVIQSFKSSRKNQKKLSISGNGGDWTEMEET